MVQEQKQSLAKRDSTEVGAPAAPGGVSLMPHISEQSIAEAKRSLQLLQRLVTEVLREGIHYGQTPGTRGKGLWDPGASEILGAFNCYAGERRMLRLEDTPEKVVVCIEVPIISRLTGQVVTTGVAAASTMETKYKYRWEDDPKAWGYADDEIAKFKRKLEKGITKWRIPNPERSELLHTLVTMCSKRAECDAAKSLPGVGTALKILFTNTGSKGGVPSETGSKTEQEAGREQSDDQSPRWTWYWTEVRKLGYTNEESHKKLEVASMKDWLAKGKSLEQALDVLRGKEPEKKKEANPKGQDKKPTRLPSSIKTLDDMYKAVEEDFGLREPQANTELNVNDRSEITESPANCYLRIMEVHGPPEE